MNDEHDFLEAILRRDFVSFIGKAFNSINPGSEYQHNWHIELIAEYLEAVRNGHIKRLIINMPPRALKSVCINVAWPCWLLGQDPSCRIISASYSQVLSVKHSLDSKIIIESSWYKQSFPATKISKKHNQKSKFLTTQNGFRFATSVGGSITGDGGDILIIDDPHNPTQINSKKFRDKAINWFEQTFVTRLNNKNTGAIVLVMQRLHQEDLSAHLISNGGWEMLKIPAMADEQIKYSIANKEYIYNKGDLLNINLDQLEFLQKLEHEIGSRNFAAQYMQSPVSVDYNLIKLEDMSFYQDAPTDFEYYAQSWDTAIKVSDDADYSVCSSFGYKDGYYYLLDLKREKMSYPDLKINIEQLAKKYQPKHILIEDKASGQSVIQDLRSAGYINIIPIKPKLDKITRFASAIPFIQSGKILFPKNAVFNRFLYSELLSFPNSKNDDIVDSISQFINFVKNKNHTTPTPRIRNFSL